MGDVPGERLPQPIGSPESQLSRQRRSFRINGTLTYSAESVVLESTSKALSGCDDFMVDTF